MIYDIWWWSGDDLMMDSGEKKREQNWEIENRSGKKDCLFKNNLFTGVTFEKDVIQMFTQF